LCVCVCFCAFQPVLNQDSLPDVEQTPSLVRPSTSGASLQRLRTSPCTPVGQQTTVRSLSGTSSDKRRTRNSADQTPARPASSKRRRTVPSESKQQPQDSTPKSNANQTPHLPASVASQRSRRRPLMLLQFETSRP